MIAPRLADVVAREIEQRFAIHHATIQIEVADSDGSCALAPEHVV